MTVSWSIQYDAIILVVEGNYTSEELERAVSAALYSPQFPAGGALLIDSRLATTEATPEFLDRRAKFVTSLLDHGVVSRCAVVPAKDRRHVAAAVRAKVLESGGEMLVLRDMDAGRDWLGDKAARGHRGGPLSGSR
jgi:hypothetical protein